MGSYLRVGLSRCGLFSLILSPIFEDSSLKLWEYSGLSLEWPRCLCFCSTRRCLLRWLSYRLSGAVLSSHLVTICRGVRGNRDCFLRLHYRVIAFTQYSTVWPKVLTGGSSVRQIFSAVGNQMLIKLAKGEELVFHRGGVAAVACVGC